MTVVQIFLLNKYPTQDCGNNVALIYKIIETFIFIPAAHPLKLHN